VKVKALYGFSPELAPFAGKRPAEQMATLRSWGVNAIFGGYENPVFVEAAHAGEIAVYAEFSCFAGAEWWERVPASRPITDRGQPLEEEDWYYGVNPTVPQVRHERLAALKNLLMAHAIDGVWLDFIRWPCHWEAKNPYLSHTSFDPETLARFSRDTGIYLPPSRVSEVAQILLGQYEEEWISWRCEQITSWVTEARRVLKRVRPDALVGLFGVPWRLADHEGAILKVIGQDYRALGQHVDVFSPMVYHRMCGRRPAWIGEVTEEIHELSAKPVWPIVQSVNKPSTLPAEEYGQALDMALHHQASGGVLVFTMESALDEDKLAITKAKFGGC